MASHYNQLQHFFIPEFLSAMPLVYTWNMHDSHKRLQTEKINLQKRNKKQVSVWGFLFRFLANNESYLPYM